MSYRQIKNLIARRWREAIASGICGVLLAIGICVGLPKIYIGSAQVLIVNENTGRDPTVTTNDLPNVATSSVVLSRASRSAKLSEALVDVRKRVSAKVFPHSSLMEIEFKDHDPATVVAFTNSVADELTKYIAEISSQRYNENVHRLNKEIINQEKSLHSIDNKLQALASRAPEILEATNSDVDSRIHDLEVQQALAQSTLDADSATLRRTGANYNVTSMVSRHEALANDPTYERLLTAEAKNASRLTINESSYTPQFPGTSELRDIVETQRKELKVLEKTALDNKYAFSPSAAGTALDTQRMTATVEGDVARVHFLNDALAAQRSQRLAAVSAVGEEGELEIHRDTAKADLLELSNRRALALANRAEAASLGSVVVVDRAVEATPQIKLGPALIGILGFAFVAIVVCLTVYVCEIVDPRLTDDQIQRIYGRPVFADLSNR